MGHEVYPKSLVKKVIFQIRFPNLFYLKDKIGEFQTKIMKDFPNSEMLVRKALMLTDEVDLQKISEMRKQAGDESTTTTIWKFVSEHGVVLNVTPSTLDLTSENHKSYAESSEPFRAAIESTTSHFLESTRIPILKRVGLRYIDECPVTSNDSKMFGEFYNTAFPLDRFPIEVSDEMNFSTVIDQGKNKFRYTESLKGPPDKRTFILDTDSWAENVVPQDLMATTDHLHQTLWNMFDAFGKEPLKHWMTVSEENDNGTT